MDIGTSERAETKSFRLSKRLAVDITVGPGGLVFEWEPAVPQSLTRKEMQAYRKARDEMVERLSEMVGGGVLVVEL